MTSRITCLCGPLTSFYVTRKCSLANVSLIINLFIKFVCECANCKVSRRPGYSTELSRNKWFRKDSNFYFVFVDVNKYNRILIDDSIAIRKTTDITMYYFLIWVFPSPSR